jgi:hypothetical protein
MSLDLRYVWKSVAAILCFIDNAFSYYNIAIKAIMIMIVWLLDLQLPVQSVPITTNVVSLNPAHGECTRYNIMW